jgi:hypothetical protein
LHEGVSIVNEDALFRVVACSPRFAHVTAESAETEGAAFVVVDR